MSAFLIALQLVLTVLLTSIVIYLYSVVAFNFFRKFYVKDEDGEKDYKCNDMLTVCLNYYLYKSTTYKGNALAPRPTSI